MIPPLAQLPDISYLLVGCVILAILCLIGFGVILRAAQNLRAGIASEIGRELQKSREASPVSVQQPLIIKPEAQIVTQEELTKIDKNLHGRLSRERLEIDAQIRRVEQVAEKRSEKIEDKLDQNTLMTSQMKGEVSQINQNVHQLTTALTTYLQSQASK
jgi:hypothetical protein